MTDWRFVKQMRNGKGSHDSGSVQEWVECPHCSSVKWQRSVRHGGQDFLRRLPGRFPWRCNICRNRFYLRKTVPGLMTASQATFCRFLSSDRTTRALRRRGAAEGNGFLNRTGHQFFYVIPPSVELQWFIG